jgi:hypothetical protein
MADEWRVEVDLHDREGGYPLGERLRALDLDDDVRERLGERVIVTRDGARLYVYTESETAVLEAERVVREVLAEDELTADVRVRRWNPVDRFWQDPSEPLRESPETVARDPQHMADEEGIQHPLFAFIESYEPRFMRDLGV